MRLHSKPITPVVELDPGAHRPIVMRLAGLRFCLSLTEARTLADGLHDAAEQVPAVDSTTHPSPERTSRHDDSRTPRRP